MHQAMATESTGKPTKVPPTRRRRYAGHAVPHLTPQERSARGKAARMEAPRSVTLTGSRGRAARPDRAAGRAGRDACARAGPDPLRADDGLAVRVLPRRRLRDGRRSRRSTPRSGPQTQLCGDAHLSNFGGFASPERELVFDVNDFDETLPGPLEWDLKRLVASIAIAGRERGFTAQQRRETVRPRCASTARRCSFAAMRDLESGTRGSTARERSRFASGATRPAQLEGFEQGRHEGAAQGQQGAFARLRARGRR